MFCEGDRQYTRASAAYTRICMREKVENLPHQKTCFIVFFTSALPPGTLENHCSFIRSISHCTLPSSNGKKIIILAGKHLIKFYCICFGSHSMENLLLLTTIR